MDFTKYPTYSPYRAIRRRDPMMRGQDVFALQTALNFCLPNREPLDLDGIAGDKTAEAIWAVQREFFRGIPDENDGKAGQNTQAACNTWVLAHLDGFEKLPPGLGTGQIARESSNWVGNYSGKREDGSYDAGVVQMNTAHTEPRKGFDVPWAIQHYIDHTLDHYNLYFDRNLFVGDDHSEERRWGLAAGAWNAPAYAAWLAGVKPNAKPGETAQAKLEEYILDVTAYCHWDER